MNFEKYVPTKSRGLASGPTIQSLPDHPRLYLRGAFQPSLGKTIDILVDREAMAIRLVPGNSFTVSRIGRSDKTRTVCIEGALKYIGCSNPVHLPRFEDGPDGITIWPDKPIASEGAE